MKRHTELQEGALEQRLAVTVVSQEANAKRLSRNFHCTSDPGTSHGQHGSARHIAMGTPACYEEPSAQQSLDSSRLGSSSGSMTGDSFSSSSEARPCLDAHSQVPCRASGRSPYLSSSFFHPLLGMVALSLLLGTPAMAGRTIGPPMSDPQVCFGVLLGRLV